MHRFRRTRRRICDKKFKKSRAKRSHALALEEIENAHGYAAHEWKRDIAGERSDRPADDEGREPAARKVGAEADIDECHDRADDKDDERGSDNGKNDPRLTFHACFSPSFGDVAGIAAPD